MFDALAIESGKLGYYVYALFDPDDPTIPFYIGKGSGNRVFVHAGGSFPAEDHDENLTETKLDLIRAIKGRGKDVVQVIVRYGIAEDEAFRLECALIDMINTMHPGRLKNVVSGRGTAQTMMDVYDLIHNLNAPQLEPKHKLLIIKIEAHWPELLSKYNHTVSDIPEHAIYEAVRGNWKINMGRAQQAECILAVARGLVRGVFVAEEWRECRKERGRRCFVRKEGEHEYGEYLGKSVTELFTRGNQNPVRYIGC